MGTENGGHATIEEKFFLLVASGGLHNQRRGRSFAGRIVLLSLLSPEESIGVLPADARARKAAAMFGDTVTESHAMLPCLALGRVRPDSGSSLASVRPRWHADTTP